MLDFVLGIALAGLLVRGWFRGLVREALDLVGLFVGLWVALRLSAPVGKFLVSTFGVSPELAGIGAGVLLFVLFGVATSIAAHYLTRLMKLPGLNLANRVGGAAVASAWGVLLILVAVNVARAFPLPETFDDAIEESSVVNAIAGPDALPQAIFDRMAPDSVLSSLASLQSIFGSARAVPEGSEVIEIPSASDDEVRQVRDEIEEVLRWINEFRTGESLRALTLSTGMTSVSEERGITMYTSGRISRATPPGGTVQEDLNAAGIRLSISGENLALASSSRAGFEAMLESATGRGQLEVSGYDRIGIAVVEGPTGRLLIVVLGG